MHTNVQKWLTEVLDLLFLMTEDNIQW